MLKWERTNTKNQRSQNRLDKETLTFHQKVIEGYKTLIKTNPERFKVVDATQNIESVVSDTYEIILSYLKTYDIIIWRGVLK